MENLSLNTIFWGIDMTNSRNGRKFELWGTSRTWGTFDLVVVKAILGSFGALAVELWGQISGIAEF